MFGGFEVAVDGLVRRISYDAKMICARLKTKGSLSDEDDLTSRLAQEIEKSINGRQIGGVTFTALTKKTTWRGPKAEEGAIGADLLLVLNFRARDFEVSKGYLVQAKINGGAAGKLAIKDKDLAEQCKKMLKHTCEAYVWAYSPDGIGVARAGSYLPLFEAGQQGDFSVQSFNEFLRNAFRSRSGDYQLAARNNSDVAGLAEELRVGQTLVVTGSTDGPEFEPTDTPVYRGPRIGQDGDRLQDRGDPAARQLRITRDG